MAAELRIGKTLFPRWLQKICGGGCGGGTGCGIYRVAVVENIWWQLRQICCSGCGDHVVPVVEDMWWWLQKICGTGC